MPAGRGCRLIRHTPLPGVAGEAIRAYIETESHADLIERVMDAELPRFGEALERLGR